MNTLIIYSYSSRNFFFYFFFLHWAPDAMLLEVLVIGLL